MAWMCSGASSQFFFPKVLAKGLEPRGGVDELNLALAVLRLAIGEHPNVGGDARVVEDVERKGDDRL